MVQAFPGPQDVVGVRRWRVRCGLPTIRELAAQYPLSLHKPGDTLWLEGIGADPADATIGADDEGEGERVPVVVGVGCVSGGGFEGAPVAPVVGGDVGAVGSDGDPSFCGGVVGDGGAEAVGWGCGHYDAR